MLLDAALLDRLVCPRDRTSLVETGAILYCAHGHHYPVIQGVPVLLVDGPQTLSVADATLAAGPTEPDPWYPDRLGISPEERAELMKLPRDARYVIDPVVSFLVGATNGIACKHLVGRLTDYPVPELRLPPGDGRTLLDIGCNWGRWCLAATRLGYQTIGIDPSLGAVLAAKRVAAQLGVKAHFVVGDARCLPFRDRSLDTVFSYSVIQHFSRDDARKTFGEIGRVLASGGRSLLQMPTIFGIRCLYHQFRVRFREPRNFEVRYWSIPALRRTLRQQVGASSLSVDCYFGIGLQKSDLRLMPQLLRAAIRTSEVLRHSSRLFPPLKYVADSVYVESRKL